MDEFKRVKDKVTGHEYSARRPNLSKVDVIDKTAVDANGRPLPAKPKTSVTKKAAETKASRPKPRAAKTAPRTDKATEAESSTPNPGVEPATTPEEGSAS